MISTPSWPWLMAGVYLGLSLLTFVLYAWDKAAARRDARRIPEQTLLLWGLAGGWPGALAAQRLLCHKTRKLSFQLAFWGTVVLHGIVVTALLLQGDGGVWRR